MTIRLLPQNRGYAEPATCRAQRTSRPSATPSSGQGGRYCIPHPQKAQKVPELVYGHAVKVDREIGTIGVVASVSGSGASFGEELPIGARFAKQWIGESNLLPDDELMERATGRAELYGEDVRGPSSFHRARGGLGLVFEDRRVLPDHTVAEDFALGAQFAGGRVPKSLEEIGALFHHLEDRRAQRAGTLTGGEIPALAIARAAEGLGARRGERGPASLFVDRLITEVQSSRLDRSDHDCRRAQAVVRTRVHPVGSGPRLGTLGLVGSSDEFDAKSDELEGHLTVG